MRDAYMKVVVGSSIYTDVPSAFGGVSGEIEVPVVPIVGDAIGFLDPKAG